jgi:hypothetical protein
MSRVFLYVFQKKFGVISWLSLRACTGLYTVCPSDYGRRNAGSLFQSIGTFCVCLPSIGYAVCGGPVSRSRAFYIEPYLYTPFSVDCQTALFSVYWHNVYGQGGVMKKLFATIGIAVMLCVIFGGCLDDGGSGLNTVQELASIDEVVKYLAWQTGGKKPDKPVKLIVNIDLGTMTQAGSGWRQLLDVINTADKYVNLDLSACTMDGTEFNPDYMVATGKNKITAIALPDTATSIADSPGYADDYQTLYPTFKYFTCLTSFSGNGLKTIGDSAFYVDYFVDGYDGHPDRIHAPSNLVMTALPAGITSIGKEAFYGCTKLALTSLPAGITSIGGWAFTFCTKLALTSLPAELTSIGRSAFGANTSLTRITLPAGLTFIGVAAFSECTNLAQVICLAAVPPTLEELSPWFPGQSFAFSDIDGNTIANLVIRVPAGSVAAYKTAWSEYADIIIRN